MAGVVDPARMLGSQDPFKGCPAEFNGDAVVDAADLAQVLGA